MSEKSVARLTAVVVTLAVVMDLLDTTVVTVAVPTLQEEFGAGPGPVQWVVTAYLLAIAVSLPLSGWVSRRFGQGRAFLVALGVFGTASALTAAAWSLPTLIVFRAIQGLGGGLILPIGMALLFAAFPADQRAKASAVISVPAALAPVLGPVIGGWFVQEAGWRWVFWLNVPIAAAAILAGRRLRLQRPASPGARFDLAGVLLVSAGLVLLVLGLTGFESGADAPIPLAAVAASLLLLAAFVALQLRREHPLLNVRLLGRREICSSNLAFLLTSVSYGGLLFVLPLYLQGQRGMPPLHAGLLTSLHALGIVLAIPFATRFTRRFGPRVPLVAGLGLMAAGAVMLAAIEAGPEWLTWAAILTAGAGFGTTIVPLQTATVAGLNGAELADGSTMVNMARQIGMAVGVAAAAAALTVAAGIEPSRTGYSGGLLLTAGAAVLAIVPSRAFREPKPASRDPEHAPKQGEGTGATRAL
ncbi:DHA2 family efflux MFS transporter permease subunit [Sinomonas flava]|uniref:DHA2 family efflux MFS transporter permease subunit n=1 Tax=Sinomonas flava TaxID=496857 RepID=UPI0039A62C5A